MTASLAVIGESIDNATMNPDKRAGDPAPFCNWNEIAEMSKSGAIEIISHTYKRHRFNNEGRRGASTAENESAYSFYQIARKDYEQMDTKLKECIGHGTVAQAYPYSVRNSISDRVWMECGYQILFAGDGNDVRRTHFNYYIQDAGLNYYSAITRRKTRMTGTSIGTILTEAVNHDG